METIWWPNWKVDRLHAVAPGERLGEYSKPRAVCGMDTLNPDRLRKMAWADQRLRANPPKCLKCLRWYPRWSTCAAEEPGRAEAVA
jgi:hypothetical protein